MAEHKQTSCPWVSDEVRQHVRQARHEASAVWEAMVPPEVLQHRRAARREALLAARSMLDHVIKRLDEAEKA
ncbi:MAG: hypothetical protein NTU91_04860 [Chloroflexi bacterium]|nr:hypothetical protein [Chloroflexota bacterium]